MSARILALHFALTMACLASPLDAERVWTGKNGKTLKGAFIRLMDDGNAIELATAEGKFLKVELANLSEADRQFVETHALPPKPGPAGPDLSAFKDPGNPNRSQLPVINQKDYSPSAVDCVPSSICNFLLWWDQQGILEIPKRGDFDDKAKWVHERMFRYCDSRNDQLAGPAEAQKAIHEYFQRNLSDVATVRTQMDRDLRPENLARYAKGAVGTMMPVTLRYKNGHEFGHWVALATADEQGKLSFVTWGAKFDAVLKPLEVIATPVTVDGQSVPGSTWELEISNRGELPERMRTNEVRFILNPAKHDGLLVMKPYVFATPGKPLSAPDDPLFTRQNTGKIEQAPEPKIEVPLDIAFSTPVTADRKWTFNNGETREAKLGRDNKGAEIAKDRNNRDVPLNPEDLTPEDRAIFEFWRGTGSTPVQVPRWDLTYHLHTPKSGVLPIRICTEGTLCRVELPGVPRLLVMDTASGAFATTERGVPLDPPPPWRTTGKFAPERIFPSADQGKNPGPESISFHQSFYAGLSGTRQAADFPFPSRSIVTTLSGGPTVRSPRVDFTRIEAPAVTIGLLQLLFSQTAPASAGESGSPFVFFHDIDVSLNRGFGTLLPTLQRASMMPLRIEWTNGTQSFIKAEDREKTEGPFLLELKKASVPREFPAGYFDLPETAIKAPPGTRTEMAK